MDPAQPLTGPVRRTLPPTQNRQLQQLRGEMQRLNHWAMIGQETPALLHAVQPSLAEVAASAGLVAALIDRLTDQPQPPAAAELLPLREHVARIRTQGEQAGQLVRDALQHLSAVPAAADPDDLNDDMEEMIRLELLDALAVLTRGIMDRLMNPLNCIINFAEPTESLLQETLDLLHEQQAALPPAVYELVRDNLTDAQGNLTRIQHHSQSIEHIISHTRKLTGDSTANFQEADLNAFLASQAPTALEKSRGNYQELNVRLVLDLAPGTLPVLLQPYAFEQVMHHIVSNSCYALHDKQQHPTAGGAFVPEIRVTTALVDHNRYVQLRIRDNGAGIPTPNLGKLCSPFFTTKPTNNGTGLGLFMTKGIVEAHKGIFKINSQLGEYTELLVYLPVAATP